MTSFSEATAVRRIADDRFEAAIHPNYVLDLTGRAVGGYVVATVLRAVLEVSPYAHPVACAVHFLRPCAPGPAEIRLETLKNGRTVAVTRARLLQDGAPAIDATVSTSTLDHESRVGWTIGPPGLPPIEECLATDPAHPMSPGRRFLEQLDLRFDPPTITWLEGRPSGDPEIRTYFRLRDGDRPDPCVIALAVDAKPPVLAPAGLLAPLSTVELTLHMRAVPASDWLILHATGGLITADWCDEDVAVWDTTGRLVARSRQLARILR